MLKAFIIARINSDAAIGGNRDRRRLMFEAAQRGAFYRHGFRIIRIDFHNPAKAVRLVGLLFDIETLIIPGPLEARFVRRNAIAFMISGFWRCWRDRRKNRN